MSAEQLTELKIHLALELQSADSSDIQKLLKFLNRLLERRTK